MYLIEYYNQNNEGLKLKMYLSNEFSCVKSSQHLSEIKVWANNKFNAVNKTFIKKYGRY